MKILLIIPSLLDADGAPLRFRRGFLPPATLAQLAGLTPEKHEVRVVNAALEPVPYDDHWDLVGLSAMTTQASHCYAIADSFRKRSVPVVIGGVHASFMPDEAGQHADAVMIGEAEHAWPEILVDAENRRLKGRYVGDFWDMQDPVIPDWSGHDMDLYMHPPHSPTPMMPMQLSRGCPHNCSFCTVSKLSGKKVRHKKISHILQEIQALDAEYIFFTDDNIMGDPDFSRELFAALEKLSIRWFSQASTSMIRRPDLIDSASAAGCTSLFVGIESINEACLGEVVKRSMSSEECGDLIERLYRAEGGGIIPYPSLIFGFEHDTAETFETILAFLKEKLIINSAWWILTPLPGTALFRKLEAQGRILTRDWARYDLNQVVYSPQSFEPVQLEELFWRTYQRFFDEVCAITSAGVLEAHPSLDITSVRATWFRQAYGRNQVHNRLSPFSIGAAECAPVVASL
jgi:radical SAM superfamily enzyme YgiQ (UPF0313 family)